MIKPISFGFCGWRDTVRKAKRGVIRVKLVREYMVVDRSGQQALDETRHHVIDLECLIASLLVQNTVV